MASRKEYEMLFQLNAQLGGSYNSTFTKAQKAVLDMQKEIQALSKTQSDISAYQKQQSAVDATQKKLDVLKQQYDNIQKEMDETGNHSSDLKNKLLAKQQQIDKTAASLQNQITKLEQMRDALKAAGVNTDNLDAELKDLGGQLDTLKGKQEAAAEESQKFGSQASTAFGAVGQAIAAAGIAVALKEIVEGYAECIQASMEFESAMTGVAKTTDMSDEELASMAQEVKNLSTEIPITTTELASVAEVAGQLGIAKDDLLDFSTVMSMLSTATTMTADEAATMLAQFANITQMDPSNYSNLASTIVDLGNNYATTEQKITEMAQGIAASASLAGMSEADMMALSAAVTSLGIETQAGSTSMSKLISEMSKAVETGENLSEIATIAGMSEEGFSEAWGNDAVAALQAFVTGLSDTERTGMSATVALEDLGITEARMQRMVLSLSNSGDLLNRTMDTANAAWGKNTALTTEAEKRYATTQSQLTMMQNSYNNLKIAIGDALNPVMQKLYAIATDVLNALADFTKKHPGLVKAITAFVAIMGAAVIGLTAYAAIAKVAAAASALLTAAIPGVNVIMGVVAAVAAITAGIVALVSSANEAIPSVKELTEAARGMSETMDEATATYEATVTNTMAAAGVAETYIGKLEDLEAAGLSTNEEQKQYHNTLALLCQVVPELSDYIDLNTDTINGGTEALRANTEEWKRNAMQQAYQDQLTALYASYSEVLIEAEENSIGLTKAQYELDAANQKYNDTIARMDQMWADAATEAAEWNKEYGGMTDATNFLTQEYYDLENSLYDVNDEIYVAENSMKNYQKAIDEGSEATAEAEAEIALAEEAVRNLTEATGENAAASTDAAEQTEALQTAIGNVTAQIIDLTEKYNEAYDAAYSSISGQYALWDEAGTVVETSAATINGALESQITYWQDYNTNLQSLTDRSGEIEGLSDVIASFADGSEDSVNAIAGMAGATDEELAAMVQNWKDLQAEQETASGSIADLKTDFTATMDELQQELAADIEAMDLGTEAAQSGKDTIQGFIDGANGMLPAVQAAYSAIAQAAVDAIDAKLDINSPSKVLEIRGEYAMEGFAGGVEEMTPEVTEAMREAASGGVEAMSAEDAQIIALAPQLMAYLNGREALRAESGGGSEGAYIVLTVAPEYHITGVGSSAELEEILSGNNENLRDAVLEIMEDAGADTARRRYS